MNNDIKARIIVNIFAIFIFIDEGMCAVMPMWKAYLIGVCMVGMMLVMYHTKDHSMYQGTTPCMCTEEWGTCVVCRDTDVPTPTMTIGESPFGEENQDEDTYW